MINPTVIAELQTLMAQAESREHLLALALAVLRKHNVAPGSCARWPHHHHVPLPGDFDIQRGAMNLADHLARKRAIDQTSATDQRQWQAWVWETIWLDLGIAALQDRPLLRRRDVLDEYGAPVAVQ